MLLACAEVCPSAQFLNGSSEVCMETLCHCLIPRNSSTHTCLSFAFSPYRRKRQETTDITVAHARSLSDSERRETAYVRLGIVRLMAHRTYT